MKPFRVEADYYQEDSAFSSYGQKSVFLPEVTEIMVSKILWSLYLPKEYHFLHFKGSLEKEHLAGGLRPIMGCSKRTHYLASKKRVGVRRTRERLDQESITGADKSASSLKEEKSNIFGKFQADKKDLLRQQAMEKGFAPEPKGKEVPRKPHPHITSTEDEITAGYDTAVVSIPIAIPISGQLYRFAKTMVPQEPLKITLFYTRAWIMSIIGWFILFVVLGIVIALRKKVYEVSGYGQRVFHALENNYNRLINMASKVCRAGLTPLILMGFLLVCVVTAHFFLAFLLFLAELGLIVHQRSYWFVEKRAQLPQEIFPEEQKKETELEAEAEIQPRKPAGPKPKRRKWPWIIILNLGLILFIGGYIISSIGRYTNYRLIFLSGVAAIFYYMSLFVWWLIHKMKAHKIKGRK